MTADLESRIRTALHAVAAATTIDEHPEYPVSPRKSHKRPWRLAAVACLVVVIVALGVLMVERRDAADTTDTAATSAVRTSPSGISVTVRSAVDDAMLARISERLDAVRKVQEQNGEPSAPPECYPVDTYSVSSPGQYFDGWTNPVSGLVAEAPVAVLGAYPTGSIGDIDRDLVIVAHVSSSDPVAVELLQGSRAVDVTEATEGWAILFVPVQPDFESTWAQFEPLDLRVQAGDASVPVYTPETPGEFCRAHL